MQFMQFYAVLNDNREVKLPVDATLMSDSANDRSLYVSLRLGDTLPPLRRSDISFIKIGGQLEGSVGSVSYLVDLLPTNSKVIVESGEMRYKTQYSSK